MELINIHGGFSGEHHQGTIGELLHNDASFNDLVAYLSERTETDDFGTSREKNPGLVRAKRRPGYEQLRNGYALIARIAAGEMSCEVYENGYGIYDNGDRRTVVWIPDCPRAARSYESSEELGEERLTEEQLAGMAWYLAIVLAGEDRIERNLKHPISAGVRSDKYTEDCGAVRSSWSCGARFQNPEDEVIYKEEMEERIAELTEKQREVYQMYYVEGYTQGEIAEKLGISHQTVSEHLESIRRKITAYYEKNQKTC